VFITAMQITDPGQKDAIIAAVIVFRVFYFWIPALISVVVVLLYERSRLADLARAPQASTVPAPPVVAPGLDPNRIEKKLEKKPL
ncbi:membrane protein, partial [Methylobacterium platani JCM 14648]